MDPQQKNKNKIKKYRFACIKQPEAEASHIEENQSVANFVDFMAGVAVDMILQKL